MNASHNAQTTHDDDLPRWFVTTDEMSNVLARNWWAIAIRGVAAILFGIIAVLMPDVTIASLVLLFAAYMLIDGLFAIVAGLRAARRHERWGALILEGIADLIACAIALVWPLATVLAFVYLLAAWAIVSGALLIGTLFRLERTTGVAGRWLLAFSGVISVVWGILLILWPFTGAVVLTWWLAGYALFFGGALLVLAFRLRRRQQLSPSGTLSQGSSVHG